jgi:hypothetical protein
MSGHVVAANCMTEENARLTTVARSPVDSWPGSI